MKKEFDEKLVKDFSYLFKDRYGSIMESCLPWGIECGDGWFNIIYNLSKEIEEERLKLPKEEQKNIYIVQIKEKYGTLRYYLTSETQEMSNLISEAEDKSLITCEQCGNKGQLRGNSWLFVSCEEHSRGIEVNKYKQSFDWSFYCIRRWFIHPKYSFEYLIKDIKWKLWKIKRFIKRALK